MKLGAVRGDVKQAYSIDMSGWPVAVVDCGPNSTTTQLAAHLVELGALLARREPFTLVYDTTASTSADAGMRKVYADFMRDNRPALARYCRGCAAVVVSPLMRGAITAVLWVVDSPFTTAAFATREECLRWAAGQLRK